MDKIQEISLYQIRPSAMNPRKTFDQEGLQELADNIKRQGLLQPITVRPADELLNMDGTVCCYEIVCGERRYRAMKLTGSKTIHCIVKEMTDEQAFDAMITENLQRQDVDPTEEAFAFAELSKRGQTAEDIALRFGKSKRFVLERIKLNALIPELTLKLKEGKMSISAAMIICKLGEESQKDFYNRHKSDSYSVNKYDAERFCNNLFCYISNSEWEKGNHPDFTGGCGRKCQQCEFNTMNAGCLFYEMKADDKTAKCTNREKFLEKKILYFLALINEKRVKIVKAGGTLEFGKIAIVRNVQSYCRDTSQLDKLIDLCKEMGYEVFNREDVFDSYSWYDENDERLKEKLANHEVYECFDISCFYDGVDLNKRYYSFKKDLAGADSETITESATVAKLAEKYKKAHDKCLERRTQAYAGLFSWDVDKLNGDPLDEDELNVLAAYMLRHSNYYVRNKLLGNSMQPPVEVAYDYVLKHPEQRNVIFRDALREHLNGALPSMACTVQQKIAGKWFGDEAAKIEQDFTADVEKKCSKTAKELDEMGYDTEGKKKPKKKSEKPKLPPVAPQYKAMKEKHPDAVILFRVGDFYESYFQDAVTVSNTLGIVLTKRNGTTNMASFPHHALDTYLPKLTRAGLRVAICDQLEQPEKTTKRGKK